MGAGRNVALMVVGGAALIIGAAIGGTAGVLIAVAGAAVGLYGLFNFIQKVPTERSKLTADGLASCRPRAANVIDFSSQFNFERSRRWQLVADC
jgi:hypothetical protein